MQDYVKRILSARVYDVAIETALDPMPRLAARLGRPVRLKREDLQPIHSFKLRGAYNKMARLAPEALARGVVCASAGNHAQGVALAAQRLGVEAVVVMPRTTPRIKVEAVAVRGARVVLHGDGFDEASAEARRVEAEEGRVFVHPFDDADVIAGQGTVGMEILRQHPDPVEAIFVPIGGGGLAAGVAAYAKFLRPGIRLVGVEPEDAASMAAALAAGERVRLGQVGLFADGVAVRQAGSETFRLCQALLDEVITVSADEICAGVRDVFDDTRAVAEPSGALSVAGLKRFAARDGGAGSGAGSGAGGEDGAPGGALVAINTGANLNFDRLRHIAERAEIGERREALLAVTIPEEPGSYRRFVEAFGERAITEFNYRYSDPRAAHVFVGVAIDGAREAEAILARLRERGYAALDMSGDEMAKLHVRHMVGGRAAGLADERLFRFEFPERPGALRRFLDGMARGWTISLFHYRNHGADHGRVLVGLQVPPADDARFERFLDELGYPHWEETGNAAYALFLQGRPDAGAA